MRILFVVHILTTILCYTVSKESSAYEETDIKKKKLTLLLCLVTPLSAPASCGACRELMVQLMPNDYKSVEIMLDCENGKVVTLGELTPE